MDSVRTHEATAGHTWELWKLIRWQRFNRTDDNDSKYEPIEEEDDYRDDLNYPDRANDLVPELPGVNDNNHVPDLIARTRNDEDSDDDTDDEDDEDDSNYNTDDNSEYDEADEEADGIEFDE